MVVGGGGRRGRSYFTRGIDCVRLLRLAESIPEHLQIRAQAFSGEIFKDEIKVFHHFLFFQISLPYPTCAIFFQDLETFDNKRIRNEEEQRENFKKISELTERIKLSCVLLAYR